MYHFAPVSPKANSCSFLYKLCIHTEQCLILLLNMVSVQVTYKNCVTGASESMLNLLVKYLETKRITLYCNHLVLFYFYTFESVKEFQRKFLLAPTYKDGCLKNALHQRTKQLKQKLSVANTYEGQSKNDAS